MPIKVMFLISALFLVMKKGVAQNQVKADSLIQVLNKPELSDSLKIVLIERIITKTSSPDQKLRYADELLQLIDRDKHLYYLIKVYQLQGVAYRLKGHLDKSLNALLKSAQFALQYEMNDLAAEAYLEIAATFSSNSQHQNALQYELKAINIMRKSGEQGQLAINLLNTGYSYYNLGILDSALLFYNEAEPLFDSAKLAIGKAYVVGNRAVVYHKQGDHQTAENDLLKAIEMLKPLGDHYGMADYHNQLAKLYAQQKNIDKAIKHTSQALQMAEELDLKEQIRDASYLLAQLYESQKDFTKALQFQKQYVAYKDSIENTETTKRMADLRTEFEVNLREKEIDLLQERQFRNRIYIIIGAILLVFTIVLLLYFRQRFLNTKLIAAQERKQHNDKVKNLLSTQETKALQSMVKGQESERKRLAQDLHNHFGSLLATIKVNINGIEEKAIPNHATLTKLIDQACNDIRNASHELNMGIANDFGLVPALKELVAHLQNANDVKVEFSATLANDMLKVDDEICIYRIIQELVSNVLKHARANKLSISLTFFEEENIMNILVVDNGKGFDITKIQEKKSGIGLHSLISMVEHMHGEISIDSNASSGTTVNIDLPITPQDLQEI